MKQSCYKGIEDVTVKKIHRASAYKTLVKEANEQIEKNIKQVHIYIIQVFEACVVIVAR